ncbi:MAG: hypothetical protein P8R54_21720 [Myxococcota bacterium]|nr:hypothetical protein [Myxococcota bacterium]
MLLFLTLSACTEAVDAPRVEPSFIVVEMNGETGSAEDRLAFSAETVTRTVTVSTLDADASPYPYTGELTIRVRPGKLESGGTVTLTNGEWTGDVSFSSSYGPTRIWLGDEREGSSYATGVTEPMYFAIPTISEINDHEDTETNHLDGEFAELRLDGREVVVTAVGTDGFWATDQTSLSVKGSLPGNFASLYVYSFGKPEGVSVGSRLTVLNGNDQEYLGTTQLSFPVYEAEEDATYTVYDPIVVDGTTLCTDRSMEALESAIISIPGGIISTNFTEGSDDYEDYLTYGQWPISLNGCEFYVDTSGADFTPAAGMEVSAIEGIVSQVFSKWVILVTGSEDIEAAATRPIARPVARHRDGRPSNVHTHAH